MYRNSNVFVVNADYEEKKVEAPLQAVDSIFREPNMLKGVMAVESWHDGTSIVNDSREIEYSVDHGPKYEDARPESSFEDTSIIEKASVDMYSSCSEML
jgi:hypothetical protein